MTPTSAISARAASVHPSTPRARRCARDRIRPDDARRTQQTTVDSDCRRHVIRRGCGGRIPSDCWYRRRSTTRPASISGCEVGAGRYTGARRPAAGHHDQSAHVDLCRSRDPVDRKCGSSAALYCGDACSSRHVHSGGENASPRSSRAASTRSGCSLADGEHVSERSCRRRDGYCPQPAPGRTVVDAPGRSRALRGVGGAGQPRHHGRGMAPPQRCRGIRIARSRNRQPLRSRLRSGWSPNTGVHIGVHAGGRAGSDDGDRSGPRFTTIRCAHRCTRGNGGGSNDCLRLRDIANSELLA